MQVWNDEGQYLVLVQDEGGNLTVSLTDEGREELADMIAMNPGMPDYARFADLFDDFLCTGWSLVPAEDIGALTGCQIIITHDAEHADDGTVIPHGPVYWHERYQVEDFIGELLVSGECTLRVAA
jgi:hypothetical protein